MSEETTATVEVTTPKHEIPWKEIWMALGIGAAAAGGTYLMTRKVTVAPESDSNETDAPEA